MTIKYAVVNPDNSIVEFRYFEAPPVANTENMAKPRLLPVRLVDVTFDAVSEVHVGPAYEVFTAEVVETWTKRPKDATEIEAMRAAKINEVHFQADIHLDISVQHQTKSLSILVDLLYRHTDVASWPLNQQEKSAKHLAKLDEVESVGDVEDAKVVEVEALPADPHAIAAYDATAGWP